MRADSSRSSQVELCVELQWLSLVGALRLAIAQCRSVTSTCEAGIQACLHAIDVLQSTAAQSAAAVQTCCGALLRFGQFACPGVWEGVHLLLYSLSFIIPTEGALHMHISEEVPATLPPLSEHLGGDTQHFPCLVCEHAVRSTAQSAKPAAP